MTLRSAIGRIAAYAAAFVAASTVHLTAHGALLYAFDDFFFASPAPTQTVAPTSASAIAFTGAAYFCTSYNGNPGGSCGGYGNDASTFTITPDPGYALNITGFSFDGYWQDRGRADDYERAIEDFDRMKAEFLPPEAPAIHSMNGAGKQALADQN